MREIYLTKGKVALVDDKDYDWLNQWKWCANLVHGIWYAKRAIYTGPKGDKKQTMLKMHRVILDVTNRDIFVDHRDHNGLNNQRYNIRKGTQTDNARNKRSAKNATSKYVGVYMNGNPRVIYKKWVAKLYTKGVYHYLGNFANEEDAARAYNQAAMKYYGEFANLNPV